MSSQLFSLKKYLFRRRIFAFLGLRFDYRNESGENIAFSHMKAFKFKEEMCIYSDETMTTALVGIKAQNIIDFSAKYDVTDKETGVELGTWGREGLKSIIRDSWKLDLANGKHLVLEEDSTFLALLRRFLSNLIPQTYYLKDGEKVVATYSQTFNPFMYKLNVEINDPEYQQHAKIIAAGAMLLGTIEGRQN